MEGEQSRRRPDLNSAHIKAVWLGGSYLPSLSSSQLCSAQNDAPSLGKPPGPQVPVPWNRGAERPAATEEALFEAPVATAH